MENELNEDVRKLVSAIRKTGTELNMSLPPARLKSEAEKLIQKCTELLSVLS